MYTFSLTLTKQQLTMALLSKSASRAAVQACRPQRRVAVVVRAQQQKPQLPAFVKPATVAAVANIIAALPASAEAGKLFDFNLTLPVRLIACAAACRWRARSLRAAH